MRKVKKISFFLLVASILATVFFSYNIGSDIVSAEVGPIIDGNLHNVDIGIPCSDEQCRKDLGMSPGATWGAHFAIGGTNFGSNQGSVVVVGKAKGLHIIAWNSDRIQVSLVDGSTFDLGLNRIVVRTTTGQESTPMEVTITGRVPRINSVVPVSNSSLRLKDQADLVGEAFGDAGLVEGGVVLLTGTDTQQQIVSWTTNRIRVIIDKVPTRQPITFTVGVPQLGKVVYSTPSEQKVISDEMCTAWTYSSWTACSESEQQTRTIISSSPTACTGGSPILNQSCSLQKSPKIISITPSKIKPQGITVEIAGENFGTAQATYSGKLFDGHHIQGTHEILSWSDTKIRAVINLVERDWLHYTPSTYLQIKVKCTDSVCKNGGGEFSRRPTDEYWSNGMNLKLDVPTCTESEWSCSDWDACLSSGKQSRKCTRTFLCANAETQTPPAMIQSCKYTPPCSEDKWECQDWNQCSSEGRQSRSCTKIFDCQSVNTPSPNTTQSCTSPRPACNEDKWECGSWNQCSPAGTQSRSCRKLFNCPDVESEVPQTSQYCQAPQQPNKNESPRSSLPSQSTFDQDKIVKSTVKLWCGNKHSTNSIMIKGEGSGTIIDSIGTILTNKHVIDGTNICVVGFANSSKDDPYHSARQIADITRISTDEDIATVTLRNPGARQLPYVDIVGASSAGLNASTEITAFGYPARFGKSLTFTRGHFSGYAGNYLRTSAILEYGNSGGGAYLNDGAFIGIPSKVAKGELNSMGFILSIDKINSWLSGASVVSNESNNGKYADVSEILKSFDPSSTQTFNISTARILAYTDTSKNEIISTNIGSENTAPSPLFKISNVKDAEGYYVYFGDDVSVDPATEGVYIATNEYAPKRIMNDGTYYFIFKAKNADNVVSPAVITEYKYKRATVVEKSERKQQSGSVLAKRLRGNILLQVESHGEAYYVSPDNEKRYYLGRPADAFQIMRELGLGASHDFIQQHIKETFPDHVVGKILIDVGDHGKAYYIYPKNKKAYYLGRPADAFKVMRELGLGISNRDLAEITISNE